MQREFTRAAVAGATIAKGGAEASAAHGDSVAWSAGVSSGAAGSGSAAPDGAAIEGAMVDLRMAKYMSVANMRVIATADEMSGTVLDLVGRERGR